MPALPVPIHELSALGAALCWAATGIVTVSPARHLGPFAFNRIKLTFVSILLLLFVVIDIGWPALSSHHLLALLLSGFVGILLGDTILYVALNRLGPRRTGVLFAMNAPITALLGWMVLGEGLRPHAIAAIGIITAGVMVAVLFGRRQSHKHVWEDTHGDLSVGIAFGLLAALAQAIGSILIRPAMQEGVDPVLASLLRVGIAALALNVLAQLPVSGVMPAKPVTAAIALRTFLSGFLSMALGMTLLLFALSGGKIGVVSTLSATTPVIILPLLWLVTGERPGWGAWAGAALVVAGMALLAAG